ncbi:MAG: hypothetical protein AAF191_13895 [Verrucomicrobiota bacterium]
MNHQFQPLHDGEFEIMDVIVDGLRVSPKPPSLPPEKGLRRKSAPILLEENLAQPPHLPRPSS